MSTNIAVQSLVRDLLGSLKYLLRFPWTFLSFHRMCRFAPLSSSIPRERSGTFVNAAPVFAPRIGRDPPAVDKSEPVEPFSTPQASVHDNEAPTPLIAIPAHRRPSHVVKPTRPLASLSDLSSRLKTKTTQAPAYCLSSPTRP
ncbi:hypothetical protein B0H12DRAFT_1236349 [Mycena haematopus]|nr:hypothetical protein B0H12DRAFT_1236349 [Mycena haematopus]